MLLMTSTKPGTKILGHWVNCGNGCGSVGTLVVDYAASTESTSALPPVEEVLGATDEINKQ